MKPHDRPDMPGYYVGPVERTPGEKLDAIIAELALLKARVERLEQDDARGLYGPGEADGH